MAVVISTGSSAMSLEPDSARRPEPMAAVYYEAATAG